MNSSRAYAAFSVSVQYFSFSASGLVIIFIVLVGTGRLLFTKFMYSCTLNYLEVSSIDKHHTRVANSTAVPVQSIQLYYGCIPREDLNLARVQATYELVYSIYSATAVRVSTAVLDTGLSRQDSSFACQNTAVYTKI